MPGRSTVRLASPPPHRLHHHPLAARSPVISVTGTGALTWRPSTAGFSTADVPLVEMRRGCPLSKGRRVVPRHRCLPCVACTLTGPREHDSRWNEQLTSLDRLESCRWGNLVRGPLVLLRLLGLLRGLLQGCEPPGRGKPDQQLQLGCPGVPKKSFLVPWCIRS